MINTDALHEWPGVGLGVKMKDEPQPTHDHTLARMASEGDMEAFEELYRRHHRRVYSLCMRMTGNVAEAEDITQEIFVHLFRAIRSFRGESAFTTWLYRLTTNQVLMHFRKIRSRKEQTSEDGLTPERATEGGETGEGSSLFDRVALNKAIAQLSPGYRMVFILHDVEGYEHEEIGRMLGVAAGTSKSQLHKARMRLRKLLNSSARGRRAHESLR